eukprot:GHVQ01000468.1.p1 GENE.GHVQ01000468.1~~GHVQ01000468.1.p1  ORF type:complete len:113 (+),score=4.83 GHVQ01000468.1:204-542(+)
MFLSTVIYGFTWSSVLYMYQMCQGGDFLRGNGFGSESIYGQFMRDEKFIYTHSKRGVLSMASTRRKHTNSCQFFITFAPCPWLDGRHVSSSLFASLPLCDTFQLTSNEQVKL